MSTRTIIEINHDCLKDAAQVLADLIKALPSQGLKELQEECRDHGGGVRVLAQRHHGDNSELLVNGHSVWRD